ncbi:MAG: class I SAM-dependent methyltransferase [Candidatus Aceula meridiana]|nr:class I SAM-dependent methyltransferase [Candidatus Aceula meridiana]
MLKSIRTYRLAKDVCCAICRSQEAKEIYEYSYENKEYLIVQCLSCGHLFIASNLLVSLSSRSMETIEDAEMHGSRAMKNLHKQFIIKKEIKKTRQIISKPHPRLLDIGCGTGWITNIWKESGFDVVGLEPSQQRARIAESKYSFPVCKSYIEDYFPEEKFDVIILRHVLEHIENPTEILNKIRSWLGAGGMLIITVPNINSIGRYLFRKNWEWVLPWHLHFFKPDTLMALTQKTGFQKVHFYQTPSPLWYPASFGRIFRKGSKLRQYFCQAPSVIKLLPFFPLILIGYIFNLNDNMTLFLKKDA